MKRLDQKLTHILAGSTSSVDFIIADAKDADMAFGITAPGPQTGSCRHGYNESEGCWKNLPQYREQIRAVIAQARTQRPLNHVRDFFDCVRSRRPAAANPEVMYRSMNICLAADMCKRLKRNLKFDLGKAEFVDDPEANRMRSRAMRAPYTI